MSSGMESLLFGGKGPAPAFRKGDPIGLRVGGLIIEDPVIRQQTDMKDGKPLTWDDGNPRKEIVVTVQTDLRQHAEDDGLRRFFIKGSSDQMRAVAKALDEVGQRELAKGGVLFMTYVGDGVSSTPGYNAPRLHTAEYTPPQSQQAQMFGAAQQQPVYQQQPVQPQPVYQQPMQQPVYQQPQVAQQQPVYQPQPVQPQQQPVYQPQPVQPQQQPVYQPQPVTAESLGVSPAAFAAIEELTAQQTQRG